MSTLQLMVAVIQLLRRQACLLTRNTCTIDFTSGNLFFVPLSYSAGVFNDQGVSDLGRLVYHVTLPALLFVNIISEVTVARLMVLWKLPVLALVHVCSGFRSEER